MAAQSASPYVEDVFRRLDADGSGQLEPAELMRMFREVMPGWGQCKLDPGLKAPPRHKF